jgi:serine/threonine-protein kinase RsbW
VRSDTPHEVKGANRSPHLSDIQAQQPVLPFHKIIPSDPSLLDDAVAGIRAAIDRTACSEEVEDIALAAREAVANAIVHGNQCDPAKAVGVSVAVNENCDLLIVVRDWGSGFDPSKLPDPTAAENLLTNHGRGIFLMKQLMDEVDFKFDHGTEVRMLRRRQWLE